MSTAQTTDGAGIGWFPEQGGPQPLIQYSAHVFRKDEFGKRYAGYVRVTVDAGPRGESDDGHRNPVWARRVEVSVSPTGRSARVWVDGVEIPTSKETPMARDARDDGRTTAAKAQEAQKQQEQDRHEKAGLPREHVEADDIPDDGTNG